MAGQILNNMKRKDIFKMVGVKDEKSFYDKYPNTPEGEKAFLAKYGKQLKKLQGGDVLQSLQSRTPLIPLPESTNQLASLEGHLSGYKMPKQPFDLKGFGNANIDLPGKVAGGLKKLKAEKQAMLKAQQWNQVSDIALQASRTNEEPIKRKYARPEDMTNTGEEFFPVYGVGTNALAREGKVINKVRGGNKTEIQNTYDPGMLYDDLGYEPIPTAQLGDVISGPIGQAVGNVTNQLYGENAGSELGGELGGTVGSIFGPVGSVVGKEVGKLAGWALDRRPAKTKKAKEATMRNVGMMGAQNAIQGMQGQFSGYMEEGGWVSHDWTPQLITKFGEHKLSDLLKDDPTMNTLRTGGNIRQNTGVPDFAMGGDLKTHWGGYAEPVSQNPFLPEGGETVMFRGQSHDESDGRGRTGIGVTYGNNPVEVERGEPAVKLQDGGGLDSDLVVFGNLKIPNQYITMLGDTNAKGKKFKSYVADLSKVENKQNKLIDKTSNELDDLNVNSSFDKLQMSSYEANIMGANMKLKEIAQKKQNAAALQQAINDTARERQLDADELAKGNVKQAKYGKMLKAEDGYTSKYGITPWEGNVSGKGKATASSFGAKEWDQILDNLGYTGPKGNKAVQEFLMNDPRTKDIVKRRHQELYGKDPFIDEKLGYGWASEDLKRDNTRPVEMKRKEGQLVTSPLATPEGLMPITPYEAPEEDTTQKSYLLNDILNEIAPYVRKSNREDLDPRQLAGEMFALSQNKLEPVRAQMFQPQLTVPYDISLQDVLNENQATFRAAQRTMGYNPAAQANLAAQQYAANQKVLGEQFRMNQAQKNQVYAQNRQLLDQAQLQNLGTLDQQYQRQEAAKSATKATTQAALNSISDKYMKNQLDNRTLQTYENMYNFRFGPDMVAQNWNAPARFNIPQVSSENANPQGTITGPNGQTLYPQWKNGKFLGYSPSDKATTQDKVRTTKTKSRNGSIVSDLKKL